jgi:hypothetical protein
VAAQQEDGQRADRDVDEEDPAPASRRHQAAAEHRAERDAERAHAAPHAERAGPAGRVRELVHDQGE